LITELKGFGVDSDSFAMMNRAHVHDLRLNVMVRQATTPQPQRCGSGAVPNFRPVPSDTRRSSLLPLEVTAEDTLPERLRVLIEEIHAARVQRGRGSTSSITSDFRLEAARKYRPQPLDLSSVALSQELQPLLLKCARHVHALTTRVPFDFAKLPQHERAASLNKAAQCLEVVRYIGFEIVPEAGRGGGVTVPEYLDDTIEIASYQQHGASPVTRCGGGGWRVGWRSVGRLKRVGREGRSGKVGKVELGQVGWKGWSRRSVRVGQVSRSVRSVSRSSSVGQVSRTDLTFVDAL
jgi:hypothetical protein